MLFALRRTATLPWARTAAPALFKGTGGITAAPALFKGTGGITGSRTFSARWTVETCPEMSKDMIEGCRKCGYEGESPEAPTDPNNMEAVHEFLVAADTGFTERLEMAVEGLTLKKEVEETTEVIKGMDGNDIKLFISKPKGAKGTLPCVYHTHGGGMAILKANNPCYRYFCNKIAGEGVCVVGVEFRNCSGNDGPQDAFPAGLNDVMSGLYWTHENKEKLGIGKIITNGESGGGNLCIAMTLRAKFEGKLSMIDGVYSICPYLLDPAERRRQFELGLQSDFPSIKKYDGVLVPASIMICCALPYARTPEDLVNPTAWPFHATAEHLKGFPPTVLAVNACDPLRDEGIAFGHRLIEAGVETAMVNIPGSPHASDALGQGFQSDYTLRAIASFAKSV
jgi:acetyl esterase/lipase